MSFAIPVFTLMDDLINYGILHTVHHIQEPPNSNYRATRAV